MACRHSLNKSTCMECYYTTICPHNKKINNCLECWGNSECSHSTSKIAVQIKKNCPTCRLIYCEICNKVGNAKTHNTTTTHIKNKFQKTIKVIV